MQHVLTMKNNFCPDEKSVDDTVKSPKTTDSPTLLIDRRKPTRSQARLHSLKFRTASLKQGVRKYLREGFSQIRESVT